LLLESGGEPLLAPDEGPDIIIVGKARPSPSKLQREDRMSLKKAAMQQAMKLMSSPTVMKLMQDPRFMQAMMGAFSLKGKVEAQLEETKTTIAKVLNLATREEVDSLKSTIRDLDSRLGTLRHENESLRRSGSGER
jgi:hypothetical protein